MAGSIATPFKTTKPVLRNNVRPALTPEFLITTGTTPLDTEQFIITALNEQHAAEVFANLRFGLQGPDGRGRYISVDTERIDSDTFQAMYHGEAVGEPFLVEPYEQAS